MAGFDHAKLFFDELLNPKASYRFLARVKRENDVDIVRDPSAVGVLAVTAFNVLEAASRGKFSVRVPGIVIYEAELSAEAKSALKSNYLKPLYDKILGEFQEFEDTEELNRECSACRSGR